MLLLLGGSALATDAADIYWTNTAGGNWSVAANWSSGSVPSSTDNVFIISNGTYTVTLNVSATVSNLTVGAVTGMQTFSNSANNLTLKAAALFGVNSIVASGGGTWTGTNTFSGKFQWSGGTLSGVCIVTTGAVVNITGSAAISQSGTVTNAGTINVASSDFGGGPTYNLAGGLFDIQGDYNVYGPGGVEFNNAGTLRKSAGVGTSSFQLFLRNTGTVLVQSGTLDFGRGGTMGGTFTAEAGQTVLLSGGNCTFDATPSFSGTVTFGNGTALRFTVPITDFTLSGGELTGTNLVVGTLNWTGGSMSGVCMVSNNAVLNISGSASKNVKGTLTNAGTMTLTGTGAFGMISGVIYNSGLFDLQSDAAVSSFNGLEFRNSGIIRKSAGTGITSFATLLRNTGLVQVQSGEIDFSYGGNFGGTFSADAGKTIQFDGGTITFDAMPDFNGPGTIQFRIPGQAIRFTVPITDFTLSGGELTGTNLVVGTLNWTGGSMSGVCMVSNNAVLNISGSASKNVKGTLTNAGTMTLTGTGAFGMISGVIYNSGLFDLQSDAAVSSFNGLEFRNSGIIRKSAGTGITSFATLLRNTGLVQVQSGEIDFSYGGNFGGTFSADAGKTIQFINGTVMFDAMPNFIGAGTIQFASVGPTIFFTIPITSFTLNGGVLSGINIVTGTLNWTGGQIGGGCTVASGGVLNIIGNGSKGFGNCFVTNSGTVNVMATDTLGGLSWHFYNLSGALFDIQSDVLIGGFADSEFENAGWCGNRRARTQPLGR